jgi:hypothetical protein
MTGLGFLARRFRKLFDNSIFGSEVKTQILRTNRNRHSPSGSSCFWYFFLHPTVTLRSISLSEFSMLQGRLEASQKIKGLLISYRNF